MKQSKLETELIELDNSELLESYYGLKLLLENYVKPKSEFGAWITWQELYREQDGGKYTFKSPKRMVSNRTKKKKK